MTPRTGGIVVLVFAGVWLWIGASALPVPWRWIAAAVGIVSLLATGWRVLRQRRPLGSGRGFDRRWFWLAVAFEVVAANIAAWWLGRAGMLDRIWPVLGIIVGLHFIGLYYASRDRRFITLTVAMVAINAVALLLTPGGAMLPVAGLGSAAALMWAASAGARR